MLRSIQEKVSQLSMNLTVYFIGIYGKYLITENHDTYLYHKTSEVWRLPKSLVKFKQISTQDKISVFSTIST